MKRINLNFDGVLSSLANTLAYVNICILSLESVLRASHHTRFQRTQSPYASTHTYETRRPKPNSIFKQSRTYFHIITANHHCKLKTIRSIINETNKTRHQSSIIICTLYALGGTCVMRQQSVTRCVAEYTIISPTNKLGADTPNIKYENK